MKFSDFFVENFKSENEIKSFIRNSRNFEQSAENPEKAHALLIFKTSKQQTWLVATRKRLYCILDDNRKDQLNINWSERRENLEQELDNVKAYSLDERKTVVDIGSKHKGWLYSRNLFPNKPVEEAINNFILGHMA